jgi:hypothetical protein
MTKDAAQRSFRAFYEAVKFAVRKIPESAGERRPLVMLIIIHLFLMFAASLCLLAGVGLAMFGRKRKFWLKGHKKLNSAGCILLAAGGIMAFVNIILTGSDHLAGLHPRIGAIAVMLVFLTLFLGFYSLKPSNKNVFRAAHRWSGRLSLIAILAALTLGLSMIGIF